MPSDNVQHLAIQTPNHPMTYLRFSGTIPEKLYGAGKVTIHDIGTYDPISWSDKKIEFTLHGKLYKNITFVLIKLSQPNEWLLIKKRGI
jgi:bifunctional non-homologous end joining protein LigD